MNKAGIVTRPWPLPAEPRAVTRLPTVTFTADLSPGAGTRHAAPRWDKHAASLLLGGTVPTCPGGEAAARGGRSAEPKPRDRATPGGLGTAALPNRSSLNPECVARWSPGARDELLVVSCRSLEWGARGLPGALGCCERCRLTRCRAETGPSVRRAVFHAEEPRGGPGGPTCVPHKPGVLNAAGLRRPQMTGARHTLARILFYFFA